MRTKKNNGILERLEAKSSDSYEKVASRMRLALKIAHAIEKSGMSKKEFAHRLDKQPSEISKWLSGTHNFTMDTLNDISRVLNIRLVDDQPQFVKSKLPITIDTYSKISSIKVPSVNRVFGTISQNTLGGYNSIILNNIAIASHCCAIV